MERKITKTKLRDGQIRHTVTFTDQPSANAEKVFRRYNFLREVLDGVGVGLLQCGQYGFQTLTQKHDGERWVIELQAVEKPTERIEE